VGLNRQPRHIHGACLASAIISRSAGISHGLSRFLHEFCNVAVSVAGKIVSVKRVDRACPTRCGARHTQLRHVINVATVETTIRLCAGIFKRGLDRQRGLYIGNGIATTDKFHRPPRTAVEAPALVAHDQVHVLAVGRARGCTGQVALARIRQANRGTTHNGGMGDIEYLYVMAAAFHSKDGLLCRRRAVLVAQHLKIGNVLGLMKQSGVRRCFEQSFRMHVCPNKTRRQGPKEQ
jgi:hypothetical protein